MELPVWQMQKLMLDMGLAMDRRKMYTAQYCERGYEVCKPKPGKTELAGLVPPQERWEKGEKSVGNDAPHIK
ncbi:hypothetical protein [Kingella potus]|uniref:hypothetical protein n=1 Tax=Kingella potus TaxID=265175 RepID=UPI0011C04D02|nr:hypothetical protein [Kingella potus]UOP00932.1 hypothetical protein LVJ84_00490 [Kingella potus]